MSGKSDKAHDKVHTCQSSVTMEKTFSEYFDALDNKAQSRYKQKLDMLSGIPDPYLFETSKTNVDELECRSWPSIEYPDIYNYFLHRAHTLRISQGLTKVWMATTLQPAAGSTKFKLYVFISMHNLQSSFELVFAIPRGCLGLL